MVGEVAAAEAATRVDAAGNENSILHKTTALIFFYSALKWWLLLNSHFSLARQHVSNLITAKTYPNACLPGFIQTIQTNFTVPFSD